MDALLPVCLTGWPRVFVRAADSLHRDAPLFQPGNLGCREMPEATRLEPTVGEERDPDASQLLNRKPNTLEHTPHLVISTFHKGNFVPRPFPAREPSNIGRGCGPSIEHDSFFQLAQVGRARMIAELH